MDYHKHPKWKDLKPEVQKFMEEFLDEKKDLEKKDAEPAEKNAHLIEFNEYLKAQKTKNRPLLRKIYIQCDEKGRVYNLDTPDTEDESTISDVERLALSGDNEIMAKKTKKDRKSKGTGTARAVKSSYGKNAYRRWKRKKLITTKGSKEFVTLGDEKYQISLKGKVVKLSKV